MRWQTFRVLETLKVFANEGETMTSPSPLKPGVFYHIFNRGTNRENVFVEERNYRYFLQLYLKYIESVAETFAYCLLKNHFHLLVRMKEVEDPIPLGSMAFSNFFNAYAKAINKAYGRTGSLFQHPFGRIPVLTQSYLMQLVRYIHLNPQKHGLIGDFREWPWSSYHSFDQTLKVSETFRVSTIHRDEVIGWFDDTKGFITAHQMPIDEKILAPLIPEDFD
jgi:putative transposase